MSRTTVSTYELRVGANRAEHDIDRELAAVFPQATERQPGAHRPNVWLHGVLVAVLGMSGAISFGD